MPEGCNWIPKHFLLLFEILTWGIKEVIKSQKDLILELFSPVIFWL